MPPLNLFNIVISFYLVDINDFDIISISKLTLSDAQNPSLKRIMRVAYTTPWKNRGTELMK